MKGTTHRLLGASCGVALGAAAGWGWPQIVASGWLATLTAAGPSSPDLDQHRLWGLLDRVLPDEWLGNNGPMQHRGVAHWWGLPASAGVLAWSTVPHGYIWLVWSLLAGWTSHLIGDWFFGRPGQGRGAGIPFAPWWNHRGLGLAVGGLLERWVAIALPFLMLYQGFLVVRDLRVPPDDTARPAATPAATAAPTASVAAAVPPTGSRGGRPPAASRAATPRADAAHSSRSASSLKSSGTPPVRDIAAGR